MRLNVRLFFWSFFVCLFSLESEIALSLSQVLLQYIRSTESWKKKDCQIYNGKQVSSICLEQEQQQQEIVI